MMRECLRDGCVWKELSQTQKDFSKDEVIECCPECGVGPDEQVIIDEQLVPNLECYA